MKFIIHLWEVDVKPAFHRHVHEQAREVKRLDRSSGAACPGRIVALETCAARRSAIGRPQDLTRGARSPAVGTVASMLLRNGYLKFWLLWAAVAFFICVTTLRAHRPAHPVLDRCPGKARRHGTRQRLPSLDQTPS